MNRPVQYLPLLFLFAACKPSKKEQLVGTWQAQHLRNDGMENAIREQRTLLDTLGNTTPASEWQARYGVTNLDSFKKEGLAALDVIQMQMADAVRKTRFQFRNDGVAIVNFGEGPDSAKYTLDEEGNLVLDELALKGAGAKLSMTIEQLTNDSLRLHLVDNGMPSTVSFVRVPEK